MDIELDETGGDKLLSVRKYRSFSVWKVISNQKIQ